MYRSKTTTLSLSLYLQHVHRIDLLSCFHQALSFKQYQPSPSLLPCCAWEVRNGEERAKVEKTTSTMKQQMHSWTVSAGSERWARRPSSTDLHSPPSSWLILASCIKQRSEIQRLFVRHLKPQPVYINQSKSMYTVIIHNYTVCRIARDG